jgi:sugar lactone lactonase YvrE
MRHATTLLEGLHFGEGPRWHDGKLWFSDFYDHAVMSVKPGGKAEKVVEVPGQPSGLGWLPDGRLLIVSMTDRKLMRLEGKSLVQHADLSGVATFHCNDMVVDSVGRAYVGNFGFDLEAYMAAHGIEAALGEPGPPTATLARVDPDGSVHVAATGMRFPNGSVVTPDGRTLIVAETLGLRLTAFDVAPDGTLSGRRIWASTGSVAPDGICLDAAGAIWVSNPLGTECVRVAEGGEVLDRVTTSQPSFAVALGGPDRKTLFLMTAPGSAADVVGTARAGKVEAVEVDVAGAGLP